MNIREKIKEIWFRWHDGTPYLHQHELDILKGSKSVLGELDHSAILDQVNQMKYCQRFHNDRICTMIMNRGTTASTLSNTAEREVLRGSLKSMDRSFHAIQYRVFAYGGLVHDFQFRTTPRVIGTKPFVVTYRPKPWPDERPLTQEIDEQEHGIDGIDRS